MLKGAIDLHIHTSPDCIPRSVSDVAAARMAAQAGMRAIMLKNHMDPTYGRAAAAQEAVDGKVLVFGGVALNVQVGGINPEAVQAAISMGGKCVWMPTASSPRHISHFNVQNGKAVRAFDHDGKPVPQLLEVLDLVAGAGCILASGHLEPAESLKLVKLAKAAGVRSILITHPEFEAVAMPVDMQKELAAQGVFFERCFYATNSRQKLPVEAIAAQIKEVGWESTIISSDFGQDYNPPPVRGLETFLTQLAACGIEEKNLSACVREHPALALGL